MTKQEAKDIAISLIAVSGLNFDYSAFEKSNISEKDQDKIINQIKEICSKYITKIEEKYNIEIMSTTNEIIDSILFE